MPRYLSLAALAPSESHRCPFEIGGYPCVLNRHEHGDHVTADGKHWGAGPAGSAARPRNHADDAARLRSMIAILASVCEVANHLPPDTNRTWVTERQELGRQLRSILSGEARHEDGPKTDRIPSAAERELPLIAMKQIREKVTIDGDVLAAVLCGLQDLAGWFVGGHAFLAERQAKVWATEKEGMESEIESLLSEVGALGAVADEAVQLRSDIEQMANRFQAAIEETNVSYDAGSVAADLRSILAKRTGKTSSKDT